MRFLSRRLVLVVLAVLAAAGAWFWLNPPGGPRDAAPDVAATEAAPPVIALPAISVAAADVRVLNDRVRASGLVDAVEKVLVQPLIEGQPIDVVVSEVGDQVQTGQVLARLSDTDLKLQKSQLAAQRASALAVIAQAEAQMIEAQASYEEARRNRDRIEQLKSNGNASQAAVDQAETGATAAQARVTVSVQSASAARAQLELVDAQIANVNLQLSRTEIRAPFAGEVVERNATAGAIASSMNAPLFVIVRDGALELNADVAEQDLPRVATGMQVSLRVAGQDETLTGVVRLVEPSIDKTTRFGRVRITVDQADRVRAGTFLESEILVSSREVLAVPITAIGTDDLGSFVMTVDGDGRVHRAPVKTGIRDGGMVEIVSGIAVGDRIVAKAASFVRDGDRVDARPLDPAPVTN